MKQIFVSLLLVISIAHPVKADLWGEITGDEARRRTSEARATANRLKEAALSLKSQIAERTIAIQLKSAEIVNKTQQIESLRIAVPQKMDLAVTSLAAVKSDLSVLDKKLKLQLETANQLNNGFKGFLQHGLIVSEGAFALNQITHTLQQVPVNQRDLRLALSKLFQSLPLLERTRYLVSLDDVYISNLFKGGSLNSSFAVGTELTQFSTQAPASVLIQCRYALDQITVLWEEQQGTFQAWSMATEYILKKLAVARSELK